MCDTLFGGSLLRSCRFLNTLTQKFNFKGHVLAVKVQHSVWLYPRTSTCGCMSVGDGCARVVFRETTDVCNLFGRVCWLKIKRAYNSNNFYWIVFFLELCPCSLLACNYANGQEGVKLTPTALVEVQSPMAQGCK